LQYIANRRLNCKDGRRWSRRVNYGSQLLCEIINFNNLPPPPSPPPPPPPPPPVPANLRDMGQLGRRKRYPLELQKAIRDVQFIRNHMKRRDEYDAVNEINNFIFCFFFVFWFLVFGGSSDCLLRYKMTICMRRCCGVCRRNWWAVSPSHKAFRKEELIYL
jgi:hypothetical protein